MGVARISRVGRKGKDHGDDRVPQVSAPDRPDPLRRGYYGIEIGVEAHWQGYDLLSRAILIRICSEIVESIRPS
jgi:hypothetical protein